MSSFRSGRLLGRHGGMAGVAGCADSVRGGAASTDQAATRTAPPGRRQPTGDRRAHRTRGLLRPSPRWAAASVEPVLLLRSGQLAYSKRAAHHQLTASPAISSTTSTAPASTRASESAGGSSGWPANRRSISADRAPPQAGSPWRNRLDQPRVARVVAELAAQVRHVDVDHAARRPRRAGVPPPPAAAPERGPTPGRRARAPSRANSPGVRRPLSPLARATSGAVAGRAPAGGPAKDRIAHVGRRLHCAAGSPRPARSARGG